MTKQPREDWRIIGVRAEPVEVEAGPPKKVRLMIARGARRLVDEIALTDDQAVYLASQLLNAQRGSRLP